MRDASDLDAAAQRLEALFPGLTAFAVARAGAARARLEALWARAHPDRKPPGRMFSPAECVVVVDALLEYAQIRGAAIEAHQVGDSLEFDDVAPHLRALAEEVLLVVLPDSGCIRTTANAALAAADIPVAGEDVVFISTASPRVLVVHHEGWIFALSAMA